MSERKPGFDPALVTGALTSCGRPDLLEETLASLAWHMEPPTIVLTEDAADRRVAELCARRFPFVRVLMNEPKLGHMASVDRLYGEITTPYVMHLEDDWRFDAAVDAAVAIAFLESRPDVSVVVLRAFDELPPERRALADVVEHQGARFAVMRQGAHPRWFGYSFNPMIGKLSFWREHGPFAKLVTETGVSQAAKMAGLTVAFMLPGAARHIGRGRHVTDPMQGMTERGAWSKLRGRLRRWGRALNPFTYAKRGP